MPDEIAIKMIQGFVRDNLQLGWSHLEDGDIPLAKHHFKRAMEQVDEIEDLLKQPSIPKVSQPQLIDI